MNILDKTRLFQTSILAGLVMGLGSVSYAQTNDVTQVPAAADDFAQANSFGTDEIVITGSRIRKSEISANTPVFTFDEQALQVRGFTNVADLLNQSPLFGGSQTPLGGQNGFTAGQNQVNLFDLGTQRTLTLVNGRRLVTSTSAAIGGSEVDLNTIPTALIERIETVPLTGAAIYGSDAIAGTVNIILKDDYEGLEFTGQYGNNEQGISQSWQISSVAGTNFADDRGNITFGLEYTDDSGILECDVDILCINNPGFDNPSRVSVDTNGDGTADLMDQSINLAFNELNLQLFDPFGSISRAGSGYLPSFGLGSAPDGNFYRFNEAGGVETCQPGTIQNRSILTQGGPDTCGLDFFDSVTQIRSPVTRLNGYGSLKFDINDYFTFRQDLVYANTEGSELVNQGGFQTGFFGGTSAAIRVPLSNPLLDPTARQTLVDAGFDPNGSFDIHRFNNDLVSLGANSNETQVWRVSNIVEGEFEAAGRRFNWDVSAIHGQSDVTVRTTGIVDGRFLNAVDARLVDDNLLQQVADGNTPVFQDFLGGADGMLGTADDLAPLDAALLTLQGANGGDTANIARGDAICGAFADLAAGTLTGFNSRASGSNLTDEDIPFLDGCTPLSLFGSSASPEALEFITGGQQISVSNNKQTVLAANLGGSLFDLPAGELGFAVGYETRREDADFRPGVGQTVPITRSSIATPISGAAKTSEFYGELNIPVVSGDMDIPLVESLEFSGAARYQKLTTTAPSGDERSTSDTVYQLNAKYAPYSDLAFRGTYATAFRNPSFFELFQPASQAFVNGADPCDLNRQGLGPNPAVRRANCESIGIDVDTFESMIDDGTISNGLNSGNPDLVPETSKAFSFGAIFTPDFIPGLQIAADYYNLEIEDSIDFVDFETLAATCFDSNDFPNEPSCNTFTRDADGQVTFASETFANIAQSTFESITARVFYTTDVVDILNLFGGKNTSDMGSLSFDAFTQHNITNEEQATPASEVTEDVGDFADPKWIGTFDTSWNYNNWLISHRMRWQNSVLIDSLEQQLYALNSSVTVLDDGTRQGDFTNKTGARFLHDLTVRLNVDDSSSVQVSVLNLLDRDPDTNGDIAFAAGHFGVDEQLGRRINIRLNKKF